MNSVRWIAVSIILGYAVVQTESAVCEDLQDWCGALGASFCSTTPQMTTFCPKTCDSCLPPECDECEQNCTVKADDTHECSCLKGYELKSDRVSCRDINECDRNRSLCDPHDTCRNFNGGYECLSDKCLPFRNENYIRSYSYEDQCCHMSRGKCGQNTQNLNVEALRIIGGQNASSGMWPWQAYILLRRDLCGGALINSLWLISAAHCFASVSNVKRAKLEVRLGVIETKNLQLPHIQMRTVVEIIRHEKYDFPRNDIALVKMNRPIVESEFIRPVCLPNGEVPVVGTKCFATGFGVTFVGGGPANQLQQVDLPIVDGDICRRAYEGSQDVDTEKMICAGYADGGKDACQGDSGGPLVCQRCDSCDWFLVGITSFGEGCATPDFYGVYTNVVNYEKWIETKVAGIKIKKEKCMPPQWTKWGDWGRCSKRCGGGSQSRIRICRNGKVGRPGCLGGELERKDCNTHQCGVDSWTDWSKCSKTCASGQQSRDRVCVTASCRKTTQKRACNIQACPTWRPWTSWGECSEDCGGGERTRTRSCRNGNVGQAGCVGPIKQTDKCNENPCPKWESWSPWTKCPVTCGRGTQASTRRCTNGIPEIDCIGKTRRTRPCNTQSCQAQFDEWSRWSICTRTCGGGSQKRTRSCPSNNCAPDEAGSDIEQARKCNSPECIGKWTAWTPWDVCSKTCGTGIRSRIRSCHGGGKCPGQSVEKDVCNTRECTGTWSNWAGWSQCDVTCGEGKRDRTRTCENGSNCAGRNSQVQKCSQKVCPNWSGWSAFTDCSQSCGGGERSRERTCGQGAADVGQCAGEASETESCNEEVCEEVPILCDGRCKQAVSWGYCLNEPRWMENFCTDDCCDTVCQNTWDQCEVYGTNICSDSRYAAVCLRMCGYCT